MNIWLLKDGENLPIQTGARKMRMWMLADRLVERGHSVVWWASTFSHQLRKQLHHTDAPIEVTERFQIQFLGADGYDRNISWARYRHHQAVAKRFRRMSQCAETPDAIVAALPTIDLSYEAVRYGARRAVPVIIDVRDLWPDVIVARSPPALQPFVRLGVAAMARKRRVVLERATSVVAVSRRYLEWAAGCREFKCAGRDQVFYLGAEESAVPSDPLGTVATLSERLRDKTVFAYVGSFGKSYEVNLIVDAAARFAAGGNRRVHFVLAGDGENLANLASRASLLPNVTLTGWLDQGSLAALLQHAHVGLAPCLHLPGTVPNKVFDYLAAGLPLVSSLEGEMATIIEAEDIGSSYRRGDLEGFCRAVGALDSDPARLQRQAGNASRLYAARYQADAIYGAYAAHIETIVREWPEAEAA